MPAYGTSAPITIATGNQLTLVNNAATDANVTKTLSAAMAVEPSGNNSLTLINTTNQTATVQVAVTDADANYVPLSDAGTAITAATNTAVSFTANGPFIRISFGTAPTSGSLILTR